MITGSYTNSDGGVHENAVASIKSLTADVLKSTTAIGVQVFHDNTMKRRLTLLTVRDNALLSNVADAEKYLVTLDAFKDWKTV